jgi:membrane protein
VSDLPGSFLALSIWILGSFVLRWILQSTVGGTSIYGPLAAPIAVLMWLYMSAIAVLIGAALNAVVDRLWPNKARQDHAAEHEPVMKAQSEVHHEEAIAPTERRPEVNLARAVEALGEPTEEKEPGAAPAGTPVPVVAEATVVEVTAVEVTAVEAMVADAADAAGADAAGAEVAGEPEAAGAEAAGEPEADGKAGAAGERKPPEERKPASVGKPGARAERDDIR